jgi:hypothetical protein
MFYKIQYVKKWMINVKAGVLMVYVQIAMMATCYQDSIVY